MNSLLTIRLIGILSGRIVLALSFVILIMGCSSVPNYSDFRATPAILPETKEGIKADARAQFRSVFCSVLKKGADSALAEQYACSQFLWQLTDEDPQANKQALPDINPKLQIYMVGGAFSECFGDTSIAFGPAIKRLSAANIKVQSVPIISRSGSQSNAKIIAKTLESTLAPGPVMLIGYSKGIVDIQHFLVNSPELAERIDAVVSIAGPVYGSLLADQGAWAYNLLFSTAFDERCDSGDGGVVDSLLTDFRKQWLIDHPLPEHIHFYSLLAFTTYEHIARSLAPSWQILANSDTRNDGQITIAEGTLPGSSLLGYLNTDHWGIALDIEHELPILAGSGDDYDFPRDTLFESVLRFVSNDLDIAQNPSQTMKPSSELNTQ